MVRKSLSIIRGVKGTSDYCVSPNRGRHTSATAEPKDRILTCLNCTKPAEKCKGKCFEKERKNG